MTILILTNKWDITCDFAISLLKKKNIEFIRINTEDLIEKNSTVLFPNFVYNIENKLNLDNFAHNITSILLRRPGKPFEFSKKENTPSESIKKYVIDQWNSFISGMVSLPNVYWINNPQKNSFAEVKINQLNLANKIGLKIPQTCITNDKNSLESFWNKVNGCVVAKALYSPLIKEENDEFFIFSNKLNSLKDVSEDELSISPTIFQEEIQDKIDYRVTIIRNQCFIVKILSNEKNILDWRTVESNIKYQVASIPNDIEEKCIKLVSELGLVFGAIDIVQNNDGYYFLEINPNGEWGWLQKNTKLPIAEALVEELQRGN